LYIEFIFNSKTNRLHSNYGLSINLEIGEKNHSNSQRIEATDLKSINYDCQVVLSLSVKMLDLTISEFWN